MDSIFKKIEIITNLAILLVALLLGLVIVKNHFIASPKRDASESGYQLSASLPNVDWRKNSRTLVLVLSNTCHFCTESAPFYQQLARARGDTRLVAVLPQPVEEAKLYLQRLGVSVDQIHRVALNSIAVRGTPTLLLVNSDGVVVRSWFGKLQMEQEAEVISKINEPV